MEFHTPDPIWETFGYDSYEKYIEKELVRGAFHPNVPEDIVNSYRVYEHLVAHAYYCYPAADEAISKLLLIGEMAIKLRCKELGIPLKDKKDYDVKLDTLIKSLTSKEPDKEISELMNWARRNRNNVVHPDQYSYGLSMVLNPKLVVSMLNCLFLSNDIIKEQIIHEIEIKNRINKELIGCMVTTNKLGKLITWRVNIVKAIRENKNWSYAIAVFIVDNKPFKNLPEHRILQPIKYFVRNLKIDKNKLTFESENDGDIISIEKNNITQNINVYKHYMECRKELSEYPEMNFELLVTSTEFQECSKLKYDFMYKKLPLIEI